MQLFVWRCMYACGPCTVCVYYNYRILQEGRYNNCQYGVTSVCAINLHTPSGMSILVAHSGRSSGGAGWAWAPLPLDSPLSPSSGARTWLRHWSHRLCVSGVMTLLLFLAILPWENDLCSIKNYSSLCSTQVSILTYVCATGIFLPFLALPSVKRDNSVNSKRKRHFWPSLVSKISSIVHCFVRHIFQIWL
jgi:hypothetical protein